MATTAPGTTRARTRRTTATALPRTTGALSGVLIVLLGLWGALIPFIGPYFHYAFGGYQTWHYTSQRLWLCIVPGAVAVIGGLMLLRATTRVGGLTAGWVALAAGAWFAVGPSVSLLWHHTIYAIGTPAGGDTRQMLEWVGYFYGLGAVIIGLAAFAMGRYFSRPRIAEEPGVAAEEAPAAEGRAAKAAVVERRTAADAPVTERERADYAPAAETRTDRYQPAAETRTGDYAPAAEAPARDVPAEKAEPAADAPVTTGHAPATTSDAPATTSDARATTSDAPATTSEARETTSDDPAATYRRRPGLLRRFRGS
jgi:hypothetical protein